MTTLGEFLESGLTTGDVLARMPRFGEGSDWVTGPNRFALPTRHPGWIENRRSPGHQSEDVAREMGDAMREGNMPLVLGAGGGLAMAALPGAKARLTPGAAHRPALPWTPERKSTLARLHQEGVRATKTSPKRLAAQRPVRAWLQASSAMS